MVNYTSVVCPGFFDSDVTVRPVNDAKEGTTQVAPMHASCVLPRKVGKMIRVSIQFNFRKIRSKPTTDNSVPQKSKIQHVLDELYKERKQMQIQIFNQEIEIKKIDKKIEEVKTSKKRK